MTQCRLSIRAIELSTARDFIVQHHRHHKPPQGHRFSLGAFANDRLCGVCVVGRPVARLAGSPSEVLEVTRLCTDGTPNACSALYAAAGRAGRELGYLRIQTYILETEPGTSLRAAGWRCDGVAGGGQWNHSGETAGLWGTNRRTDQPICSKLRWSKDLRVREMPAAPGNGGGE